MLRDGPTRDALINKENLPTGGSLFAPLPTVKQPIGPRQPNRPEDLRNLQGKLATIGRLPRVTEQPLFPQKPETIANAAKGVRALLNGVRAFQQAKGLKQDSLVNPGGPTERAIDAQNEKARNARRDRFTQVAKHILDSEEAQFKDIANRNAAESMAGLVVGKEVQEQRTAAADDADGVIPVGRAPVGYKRSPRMRRAIRESQQPKTRSKPVPDGGPAHPKRKKVAPDGSITPKRSGRPAPKSTLPDSKSKPETPKKAAPPPKRKPVPKDAEKFLRRIPNEKTRKAARRMLEGVRKGNHTSNKVQEYHKSGGADVAKKDFRDAVRRAGGDPKTIKPDDEGKFIFKAPGDTHFVYRPFSSSGKRTNEIQIIRRADKQIKFIKLRYSEPAQ